MTQTSDEYTPLGYEDMMKCLDNPDQWDVPALILDVTDRVRRCEVVMDWQLLAVLDWMTTRLKECKRALQDVQLTDATATAVKNLRGF